jgi:acetyltransferase
MTIRNFEKLLAPKSVVLIGASAEAATVGATVTANLVGSGFAGPVWLVNPNHREIGGRPCLHSTGELPGVPDLAVIATPAATVPRLIAEIGALGTRAAVVISAGVTPSLRADMLGAAKPYCLRIQGPNCLGLIVPGIGLNASFSHRMPVNGDLAFLSQSGALATAIIDWAGSRGIGFSHVVSLGDMADADFGDFLDYLAGDTQSRALLLYMEQLTQAPKFLSAARRAARAKPVIVLKAGRNAPAARAALSHTGALAGSNAAYDAIFRRAGLLRVKELGELFEAAEILSEATPLRGERLTIVTNGGGAGVLAADTLADLGGVLAELTPGTKAALDKVLPPTWSKGNPVDIIGDAGPARYAHTLHAVLQDEDSDAVLVMNCPTALASSEAAANALIEAKAAHTRAARWPKLLLANWLGDGAAAASRKLLATAGIPTFDTPDAAARSFMQLVHYRRAQQELSQTPPSLPGGLDFDAGEARRIIANAQRESRTVLSEVEAKGLLASYGIPVVETHAAADADSVGVIAAKLLQKGGACVVKILSDDISHKSDVGGVRLAIRSPEEAIAAARDMLVKVHAQRPEARVRGFAVQRMADVARAHELIVGMTDDATVGPLLMFGAGGTAVEVVADTAYALPPLDLKLAQQLMNETRICRLLCGYRDRPRADIAAIKEVLVRVSYLITQHPQICELDINPLLANEHGCIALDARVRVASAAEKRHPMAIRPYPVEWETEIEVAGSGPVLLRPIRPEDEPLYQAFFERVSTDDMRMRFFTAGPDLSHKFLARLTQIDYAREMAFVAIGTQTGELMGVARLIADPDYTRAEYGVLVRSDLKAQGLGWRLMQQLIDYASSEGLRELSGQVLAGNQTMLQMCRELGFTIEADGSDSALRTVRLRLANGPAPGHAAKAEAAS